MEKVTWRALSPSAFFLPVSLNMFLSISLLAQSLGLAPLVLLSPDLDWLVWVVSGGASALVCLVVGRSKVRWMLHLSVLASLGSVLGLLPMIFPGFRPPVTVSWLGGALMFSAVAILTAKCIKDARDVFSISRVVAARLALRFFLAHVVPLQVWTIATLLPVLRPQRVYPQFEACSSFLKLFEVLLPITAFIFGLLVTLWLWFPPVARMTTALKRRGVPRRSQTSGAIELEKFRTRRILLIGLSVLAAAFVSSYQWVHRHRLGVDASYYDYALYRMNVDGIQVAFSTDRPLTLLVFYVAEKILGLQYSGAEPSHLLRFLPVALAMILAVVTYFFTRPVGEDTAALAAAFVAVSPHVTVGVEYFIVANWLGIVLMMLFLYLFSRSVTQRSKSLVFLTIALSGFILGVHYFTWFLMVAVVVIYLLLALVEKRFSRRGEMAFCALLVLGCTVPLVLAFILAYQGGGLPHVPRFTFEYANVNDMLRQFLTLATPSNFVSLFLSQDRIFNYFGRNHYATPLLYVLALAGSLKLWRMREDRERLLRSWLIASSLGVLLVQYDELWRFLYMLPLEILAALGLTTFLGYLKPHENSTAVEKNDLRSIGLLVTGFFTPGLLLAFSPLPSSLLFLSPIPVILVELRSQQKGWGGTIFLLTVSLILEQVARALCVFV